jgi:hypothetical protein
VKLDHSVYPDLESPPDDLPTPEEKADYVHRICGAFDFGIFPERDDWLLFAGWREIFDRFPLPHSPAYHTFRARYRWPEVARGSHGLTPGWKIADLHEGREDPCENMV